MEFKAPKPSSMEIPTVNQLPQSDGHERFNTFKDEFFRTKSADNISRFLYRNRELSPAVKRIDEAYYFGTVIDLGAGESDGGFSLALQKQALTYIAVDIDSTFRKIPKQEDATINVHTEHTDMLSYLRLLKPTADEDQNIDNFILAGVDKTIILDEEYAKNVVTEIKRVATPKSTVLVICTESIDVKNKNMDLNIFRDELEKQGFEIILKVDPFTNFWAKKQEPEDKPE